MIATTLSAQDGGAYTVAGTGRYADLGLQVLPDDLRMPEAGQSRIQINAAVGAANVDIAVDGGPVLAEGVDFAATTGYRPVPAVRQRDRACHAGQRQCSAPYRESSLLTRTWDDLAARCHP